MPDDSSVTGHDQGSNPAPEEVDARIAAQPWIIRTPLTFEAWATRERAAGREPTPGAWLEHGKLTDEEKQLLDDLILARSEEFFLDEFADRFVIRDYGGQAVVGRWDERGQLATQTFAKFKEAHVEKLVEVGRNDDGAPILKPMAKHWLETKHLAPRFERVEFRPGVAQEDMPEGELNLWRGWPAGLRPGWDDHRITAKGREPITNGIFDGPEMPPGYCDRFMEHMRVNICGGNEEHLHYFLAWQADALWNPGSRDVMVVLMGKEGHGKSFWAKRFLEFFGPHGMTVTLADHLVGKHNEHLRNKSVIFADEAFFAKNRAHDAALKTLVSGETIIIEPKFVGAFEAEKQWRLIMATNNQHAVRAAADSRRPFVLHVDAGEHAQDRAYFAAMKREWDTGGRRAFFRWLTGTWWGRAVGENRFATWERPVTAALQKQKELSLEPGDEFILGILEDGEVGAERPSRRGPGRFIGHGVAPRPYGIFEIMKERSPECRGWSDVKLADVLKKWGATKAKSGERFWQLPPLPDMRAAWDAEYGARKWPDDAEHWGDDTRDEPYEPF